jgi:hypothetical protein
MNEIEKFEIKINKIDETLIEMRVELAEMKKEDEVKPVFPTELDPIKGGVDIIHLNSVEQAASMGLTGYGTLPIVEWLTARAYIIEEINKANKGDNGFKSEGENWYVYCGYDSVGRFFNPHLAERQSTESGMYFRAKPSLEIIHDLAPYYKVLFEAK